MRLGIFGGAFDPIHNGHLLLAEQCREQCQLDEVWFVPTKIPPHKKAGSLSPDADRVAMLKLAIAGRPEFVVSEIELNREEVSWTVDTLRQIRNERPDDELFLLIGADSLQDFPTWKEPEVIAELASIVAVNRGESSLDEPAADLDPSLANRVQMVTMPGVSISATDLRRRVSEGKSIRYLVPRSVEEFIAARSLFRNTAS
ncbi:MAG: nicotinate-nucleotide adenylyltransferase [Rhodopirellula sp.]|nr:nicotinate-nucleotide adenylyltransferase [Rhodopirellula sp.]